MYVWCVWCAYIFAFGGFGIWLFGFYFGGGVVLFY